ncbi:MAG: methyltransferase domain-containing protein [Pseudonocardiales bacterium]|nr:methyltransferase domain-containing protein [Pseudonocardiales bacterium]MBV9030326.1 methyltransferase domain-containing protein [Pseudonocardiales bacterium]MBW0010241.1 methyltransferase domain-containing protein [Pseudonocardiales bacterium]
MSSTYDNPSATAPADTSPAVRLIQMVQGYQVTQVVGTVARLGLADRLITGPKSSAELTRATGADPDGLVRLLRAAATVGLITEAEPDRFGLTPLGACLATHAQPVSLRDFAIAVGAPGHWLPCGRMFDAVMNGRSATATALGMGLWDYYRENPEEGATFARAMGSLSASIAIDIAACYDVTRFSRIVDIGASQGILLASLLEAAPQATGTLFDRPEMITQARAVITARGLAERVELVGGDFLTEVPPGGDLYVLKSVLHDWDDDHAQRILANCHRAARPGSTLLVVEGVVPTEPSPLHLMNLLMLVQVGGRERTHEQHQALLEAAGYRLERVILPQPGAYPGWSLLEAHRR